jgi:hypothetical protein
VPTDGVALDLTRSQTPPPIKPSASPVSVTWIVHDDYVVPEPELDEVGADVDGAGWAAAADGSAVDAAGTEGAPALASGVAAKGCADAGGVDGAAAATVVGAADASGGAGTVAADEVACGGALGGDEAAVADGELAELPAAGAVAGLKAGSEFGGSTGKASQNHPMICIPGQLSVPVWAS